MKVMCLSYRYISEVEINNEMMLRVPRYQAYMTKNEPFKFYTRNGIEIKQSTNRDGYRVIKARDEMFRPRTLMVHRVIAQQFIHNDEPDVKTIVKHYNNVRDDNRLCNLYWSRRGQQ